MTATLDRPPQPLVSTTPVPVVLDRPARVVSETFAWEGDFPVLRPEVHCLERWLDLNA